MKKLFILFLICLVVKSYTQDSAKLMKQVDSTIFAINHSTLFATSHDSTIQDIPALKLYIKTYLTMVTDGKELKKYINNGHTKREENGVLQNLVTTSSFYYNAGQLIKVEEYMSNGRREQRIEWYYIDGKPLQYVLTPAMTEKEEEKLKPRHKELIASAEVLRKSVESRLSKM